MKFNKIQKRVLLGCVFAYSTAYLNRLNLSAALGSVMKALEITQTQAGLLQTAFAVVYACGQLVNGSIVDKIRPVRYMLVGMIGFLFSNLMMGFSTGYPMLLSFCLVNGAFQSMLWTPIVRLMALKFEGEQRGKANIIISLTMILGHLGAWSISGFMVELFGWTMSFTVPALIGIPMVIAVWLLLRPVENVGAQTTKKTSGSVLENGELPRMLWRTGFVLVMISCVLYGFVRDGIVTWAPEILAVLYGGQGAGAVLTSLLIPIINIFGIFTAYMFNSKGLKNIRYCISIMICVASVFCMLLLPHPAAWLSGILMGLACAAMNGITPLLTTMVPMQYDGVGRIGLTAGLVDSFIYIGSALAGVVGGYISEKTGQNGLYLSWAMIALLAAVLMTVSGTQRAMKSLKQYNESQRS